MRARRELQKNRTITASRSMLFSNTAGAAFTPSPQLFSTRETAGH